MKPVEPTPPLRHTRCGSRHLLATGIASVLALSAAGTQAATIVVQNSGNGSSATICTLRDAIVAANTDTATGACPAGSGADTLDLPSGMTTTIGGNIVAGTYLPTIRSAITIEGNGGRLTRNLFTPFPQLQPREANLFKIEGGQLTIRNLTIDGFGAPTTAFGGAIECQFGSVEIDRVSLVDNFAGRGGGIYSEDGCLMSVINSTVSRNVAGVNGGGIYALGAARIEFSTVSENVASAVEQGGAGGGMFLGASDGGLFDDLLINSTIISGNSGSGSGDEIFAPGGAIITYRNTIIGHDGLTGFQAIFLENPNFVGENNIVATSNNGTPIPLANIVNPLPLWLDGSALAPTNDLPMGSPAIDIAGLLCPPTDRRGVSRPQGPACDAGSYERIVDPDDEEPGDLMAVVLPPIEADGTSVFKANRGVIPVKFWLAENGDRTCMLPDASIVVSRFDGIDPTVVPVDVYRTPSETEDRYRRTDDGCQYHYNVAARALGAGLYSIDVVIDGATVGSAEFELR